MATQWSAARMPAAPVRERPRAWWVRLAPPEGWLSVVLLIAVVLSATLSVEAAGWVQTTPPLSLLAILTVVSALVLARIRLRAVFLHPAGLLIGAMVIAGLALQVQTGATWEERLVDGLVRLHSWWQVTKAGGYSEDTFPFALLLMALTWLVAYTSTWFVFRHRFVWGGLLPSGIALVVNLSYLPQDFGWYFIVFLMAGLAVEMRLNYMYQFLEWRRSALRYPEGLDLPLFGTAGLFTVMVLALAWFLPYQQDRTWFTQTWENVTEPWHHLESQFDRLFPGLSAHQPAPIHTFANAIPLRGITGRSNRELFAVRTTEPQYLKGATYEVYTGRGWVIGDRVPADVAGISGNAPDASPYQKRQAHFVEVDVTEPSDVLFMSGQPVGISIAASAEVLPKPTYVLDLADSSQNRNLPQPLQALAGQLASTVRSPGRFLQPGELRSLVPPSLEVTRVDREGTGTGVRRIQVTPTDPFFSDVLALRSKTTLRRGDRYTMVTSVSHAQAADLRSAAGTYPVWISPYLALPSELPQRVRDKAAELTGGLPTNYDKAVTVEAFLRGYSFREDAPAAPGGRDGVDYFLFDSREGYSLHFASAMVIMLRSVGIPARLATGYVYGDFDLAAQEYHVREGHAHAWPEVFFSGYGWIEFSPTPIWPLLSRESSGPTPEEEGLFPGGASGGTGDEDILPPDASDLAPADEAGAGATGSRFQVPWPVYASMAMMAVLVMFLWYLWERGLRGLPYPLQVYEKMCRLAGLGRISMQAEQTPAEFGQRLGSHVPGVAPDVSQIVSGYLRARFGQKPVSEVERQEIAAAWKAVRSGLLRKILHWR